jgi:hypothetical protein
MDFKDIIDYYDGTLEESKYDDFFSFLSKDNDFRQEFENYRILSSAMQSNIQHQITDDIPDDISHKALLVLGINPSTNDNSFMDYTRSFFNYKTLISFLLGGLFVALLWFLFNNNSNEIMNHNEINPPKPISKVNSLPDINANELLAKNKALEEKLPKGIQSNSKIRIVHDTIFKEKIIFNNKPDNPTSNNQNDIVNINDTANLPYQDNSKIYLDKSVNNFYLNQNNIKETDNLESDLVDLSTKNFEPKINNQKIDNILNKMNDSNSIGSKYSWLHNYQFELKRYSDFYSSPTKSEPSYYNEFNKFGLTIHYLFNENFSTGLDIRQETFNVKYRNEEDNATVYQQPNLTTLSAEFRYNYFLIKNYLSINGSLALGANVIGYSLRPTFGTNVYLSNYFYLNFNMNYNFLYFRQYGKFHPADKFSIYYGIGVKF